jgi:diguanylate cyclase (GGDEF)-like protein
MFATVNQFSGVTILAPLPSKVLAMTTQDLRGPGPQGELASTVPAAVYEATRRMLHVGGIADAADIARNLVNNLGAATGSFTDSDDCVPIDISFGSGEPVYPFAAHGTPARWLLERHIPVFVSDMQVALEQHSALERRARAAGLDALTGLPERAAMGRLMSRLAQGDVLIAIDLDDFDQVNRNDGQQAGDSVLRAFGRVLREATRANEVCGRMGGDEFLVVLFQATDKAALSMLERLQTRWGRVAATLPGFSAGIASVNASGWRPALLAADRALLRARQSGPGTWTTASEPDYSHQAA